MQIRMKIFFYAISVIICNKKKKKKYRLHRSLEFHDEIS